MFTPPLIFGPIPPESNPPIEPQFYQPKQFFIDDITLGQTTTVTTTINHDYVIGQLVRLLIPQANGSRQLSETQSYVIQVPASNQVVLQLDSSVNVDPFISTSAPNQPQILPIGDINSGQINSSGRINNLDYIPGSFINISPL